MKSWTPPTNDMIERVLASVKKETDRQYFFSRLKNPQWVEPLRDRGYFSSPPGVKHLPDGYVQYPHWPELSYLVAVAEDVPDQVVDIILSMPKADNPRVYDDILTAALKLNKQQSAKLLPKMIEYVDLENSFFADRFSVLLQYWVSQGNISQAIEIAKKIVPFRTSPASRKNIITGKRKHDSRGSLKKPIPIFEENAYREILDKGVRLLAEQDPYQVSCFLIEAVSTTIGLTNHKESVENSSGDDGSEIWCIKLDESDRDYLDVKASLVQTMTYACEQVYEQDPQSIDALDEILRSQRWKLFKRLRQHLYALHPNEQTLPWIREEIFDHDDYGKGEHHYEFQLMIRKASEHFGGRLLDDNEQKQIFDAILTGPPKESFREWMAERFSDDLFVRQQRQFHRRQLWPFAKLLRGEVKQYFDELQKEAQDAEISDDSYCPYSIGEGGTVSYRSPKSVEDLESLSDEELLTYLNDWDNEHHDKENWLIEINISALASAFQSLFKDKIVPDSKRLSFWIASRYKIARPVYVAAMLKTILELLKDKNFGQVDQWLEFCAWVLSHPDTPHIEGQPVPEDESSDRPDWGSSRRAVVDIIDVLVSTEVDAPVSIRNPLASLLETVCTQFDWRLDCGKPVLLSRDDPVIEAINNTRSRALESLINFGFWVRRQTLNDDLPELTRILNARVVSGTSVPLSIPELTLLGMHFSNLFRLVQVWALQHREVIFPRNTPAIWSKTFGSHIKYGRPYKKIYEILQQDFVFAVNNLELLGADDKSGDHVVDRLGQFLFSLYLWGLYPLKGDSSLLQRFYDGTAGESKRWGQLFDHVGRSFSNSGKDIDSGLIDRAHEYFEWRLDVGETQELQEFTFWLQAECFTPEWRLQSFSKILDLGGMKEFSLSLQIRYLKDLLDADTPLVVECFAKITDRMDQGTQLYISIDEAKPILKVGLNSGDSEVRANAEKARENLLRLGRFDYLDI